MPEMLGTHHSKMMILLRHDETARIVIHTANMIVRDWTNMTQAVWLSPRLPLMEPSQQSPSNEEAKIGSGAKFKVDFLNYLRAYDVRFPTCKPIIDKLVQYDFSAIKGSLIASVPGRHKLHDNGSQTKWGWQAMAQALKAVPLAPTTQPTIAVQISSIATLGPTDAWLQNTFFRALAGGRRDNTTTTLQQHRPPSFKVIFPTADEIRRSLDGYASGGSIHTKIQSPQQAKQLQYLTPLFCHWANDSAHGAELSKDDETKGGGRDRAAPHIKTYIRYNKKPSSDATIDWAMVTSANLSKQAWGDAVNGAGEVRVSSYEIGVLVWPGLYAGGAVMKGAFQEDEPADVTEGKATVALRVPYSLPLQAYGRGEVPWVATARHLEPDWMGQSWQHD